MNKWVTISVMGVTTVLLIVLDIFWATNNTDGDTISEVMLTASKHPVLPFAMGVVMGHLFWPQRKDKK